MTELPTEAVMRILAQQVPQMARRAVAVPTTRLGTVNQSSDPAVSYVDVQIDGDNQPIAVLNGTGHAIGAGQRVVVTFYPPHGAIVVGELLPAAPLEQLWTATWDVTSDDLVYTQLDTGWTLETPAGLGWHDDGDNLVCDVPGLWEHILFMGWESDGGGDHRGAALIDAGAVHQVNASAQFNAPGGTPTEGFGLSVTGGPTIADYETDDTLTAEARQNSGGVLPLTIHARLRLLGPPAA